MFWSRKRRGARRETDRSCGHDIATPSYLRVGSYAANVEWRSQFQLSGVQIPETRAEFSGGIAAFQGDEGIH